MGTFANRKLKRKKFSEKIKIKDPFLEKIYSEIIEYDPTVTKVKL